MPEHPRHASRPDSSSTARNYSASGQPAHDVFVSYSSHDKTIADAVVSRFEQEGIRCWVAPRDVTPGAVWSEAVVHAIESSRLLVVVFSDETNRSRQVLREVEMAMANDIVVVPFRIESSEPSGGLAYYLASEHWLDAMTPPLDAHINKLARVAAGLLGITVSSDLSPPTPPPEPSPPSHPTPPPPPTASRRPPAPLPAPTPTAGGRSRSGGLLVPALVTAAVVVATLVILLAMLLPDDQDERTGPEEPTAVFDLETGDCLEAPEVYFDDLPEEFPVVDCDDAHDVEVVLVDQLWGPTATYPGDDAVDSAVRAACDRAFEDYVGAPLSESGLAPLTWAPDPDTWSQGNREVVCAIYDPSGPLDQTIRDSER